MKGTRSPYPEPYLRQDKGSVYYFTFVNPRTGKRAHRSTGTHKKGEARQRVKEFIDSLLSGTDAAAKVSFRQYAAEFFLDGKCPRQRRLQTDGSPFGTYHMITLRNGLMHVLGQEATDSGKTYRPALPFADLLLSEIRRSDIHELKATLSKTPGSRAGQIAFTAVRLVLAEAVEHEHLERSPAEGVKPQSRPASGEGAERSRSAFTLDEYRHLWANRKTVASARNGAGWGKGHHGVADDPRHAMVLALLLALGVRVGELRALRWRNIDLEAGTVSILDAFKGEGTAGDSIGRPKWGKVRENLRIPAPLLSDLIEYRGVMRAKHASYVNEDQFLVPSVGGGPLGRTFVSTLWQQVKRSTADAIDWTDGRQLVPHSVRHSLNTHLLIMGAPPLQIQVFLGWESAAAKSLAVMQLSYGHFELAGTDKVATVIGDILEGDSAAVGGSMIKFAVQ